MDDRLDEAFRELGRGLPFEVDWEAYERRMLARLHRARTGRRRVAAWAALAGVAAGVAASLLLATALGFGRPDRNAAPPPPDAPSAVPAPETAAPRYAPPVERPERIRRRVGPLAVLETVPAKADGEPLRRIVRRADGRTGEMVFYGFGKDDEAPSYGTVVPCGTK
jgi:hypothetical protein